MPELTCFKAYDIRDEIGVHIDENMFYSIGRPAAPHLSAKSVVIGLNACARIQVKASHNPIYYSGMKIVKSQ